MMMRGMGLMMGDDKKEGHGGVIVRMRMCA